METMWKCHLQCVLWTRNVTPFNRFSSTCMNYSRRTLLKGIFLHQTLSSRNMWFVSCHYDYVVCGISFWNRRMKKFIICFPVYHVITLHWPWPGCLFLVGRQIITRASSVRWWSTCWIPRGTTKRFDQEQIKVSFITLLGVLQISL